MSSVAVSHPRGGQACAVRDRSAAAPQALNHPQYGADVLRLLTECYPSAHAGGDRECHGCCQRWTQERTFGALGMVEFLNIDGAGLVGLCCECWGRPDRIQI